MTAPTSEAPETYGLAPGFSGNGCVVDGAVAFLKFWADAGMGVSAADRAKIQAQLDRWLAW